MSKKNQYTLAQIAVAVYRSKVFLKTHFYFYEQGSLSHSPSLLGAHNEISCITLTEKKKKNRE